eukprot:575909-Rhodomonas_salina.1
MLKVLCAKAVVANIGMVEPDDLQVVLPLLADVWASTQVPTGAQEQRLGLFGGIRSRVSDAEERAAEVARDAQRLASGVGVEKMNKRKRQSQQDDEAQKAKLHLSQRTWMTEFENKSKRHLSNGLFRVWQAVRREQGQLTIQNWESDEQEAGEAEEAEQAEQAEQEEEAEQEAEAEDEEQRTAMGRYVLSINVPSTRLRNWAVKFLEGSCMPWHSEKHDQEASQSDIPLRYSCLHVYSSFVSRFNFIKSGGEAEQIQAVQVDDEE